MVLYEDSTYHKHRSRSFCHCVWCCVASQSIVLLRVHVLVWRRTSCLLNHRWLWVGETVAPAGRVVDRHRNYGNYYGVGYSLSSSERRRSRSWQRRARIASRTMRISTWHVAGLSCGRAAVFVKLLERQITIYVLDREAIPWRSFFLIRTTSSSRYLVDGRYIGQELLFLFGRQ